MITQTSAAVVAVKGPRSRSILNGFVVVYPDVAEIVSASSDLPVGTGSEIDFLLQPLTPREIDVLNQLAAGLSNKAIAHQLTISEHTVKFHISAVLFKLSVSSRTEAVAVGIRAGLVRI
jgi:DNA-binding NarL/FixJ family response regulator